MPQHGLIATLVGALVLAFLFGLLANRLRLSPIVGYLLAGVLIGPYTPGFVADGGLVAYGIDQAEQFRLAAGYVDRILNGAKPSDLPVQQPTRFKLALNLGTAKALGVTIPMTIQATADEVIE